MAKVYTEEELNNSAGKHLCSHPVHAGSDSPAEYIDRCTATYV